MPIPPAAVDLLAAIAPVLSKWGRWYVFGAQAVTAYGVPRLSADVDITLALEPNDPERFVRDMEAGGFAPRFRDQGFARATRVMPFEHLRTGMPVDVVLAGSGLEDEFLSRARPMDIAGTTVPVLSVGDLIVAKVLAGRPKDLDDASALWRAHHAALDADALRHTLQLLEAALGQSDLVRTFDALVKPSSEVVFPLTVRFEDGSTELYSDERDLAINLEDFDSELDFECDIRDALGRQVFLRLKLLNIEELRLR